MAARAAVRRRPAGWRRVGQTLVRELWFRDFDGSLSFVERVAGTVEDYQRRPDLCILDFNNVRLTIVNPNHSGITQAELRLAEKVNAAIERPPSDRS